MYPDKDKPDGVPMTEFLMPYFKAAAKLEEQKELGSKDGRSIPQIAYEIFKEIVDQLSKDGHGGLAIYLVGTGWLVRFVNACIAGCASNLREKMKDPG